MATTRSGLLAGGLLAGTLLVATASAVAAQDPSPTPTPATRPAPAASPGWGAGMMGGDWAGGMMGSAAICPAMMGNLTPEQLERMNTLHDEMVASGTCDTQAMQEFHAQLDAGS